MDENGELHPISFHSRQLKPYEQNYSATVLECLAIINARDKYHYYVHGKAFAIYTDHTALVWLKNVKNLTGRLFRWSLKLSIYPIKRRKRKIYLSMLVCICVTRLENRRAQGHEIWHGGQSEGGEVRLGKKISEF